MSAWKVLQKQGLVRSIKNGDVYLFVVALMVVNCVYDRDPGAVSGGAARRVLSSLRGRGFRDYVAEKMEKEKRMEGECVSEHPTEAKLAAVAAEKKEL